MREKTKKLIAAPADYVGIEDLSDDYNFSAKLINSKPHVRRKAEDFIASQPNTRYGERTNYMAYGPKR